MWQAGPNTRRASASAQASRHGGKPMTVALCHPCLSRGVFCRMWPAANSAFFLEPNCPKFPYSKPRQGTCAWVFEGVGWCRANATFCQPNSRGTLFVRFHHARLQRGLDSLPAALRYSLPSPCLPRLRRAEHGRSWAIDALPLILTRTRPWPTLVPGPPNSTSISGSLSAKLCSQRNNPSPLSPVLIRVLQ